MSAPGQRGRRWGGIWPQRHWQRGASRPFWSSAEKRGTRLKAGSGRWTTFNAGQKTVLVEHAMVDGHVEQLVVFAVE